MPDVKVCLWNIQNYGQQSEKYDGAVAGGNAVRNQFITAFCLANDIDVLLIQEATENGAQAALTDLQLQLNAAFAVGDWAYSWSGSAIAAGVVNEANTTADIIYRTGARTEGYAVVWRTAQAARFTMIQGRRPIATGSYPPPPYPAPPLTSPLNMSQTGRPTGSVLLANGQRSFGSTGGYLPANVYPYELNAAGGYDLQAAWPRLDFPTTSSMDALQLRWSNVRRPVYVVIKLADAAQTLCPVAVYHAPSNLAQSSWGAFMAGMARELYVVNQVDAHDVPTAGLVSVTKGVLGGDFNSSVDQADWPAGYVYFTEPLRQDFTGGAACDETPSSALADAARRTTVQIVEGAAHDQPIVSANTADYYRYKIDLAFFRHGSLVTGQRVNLLDDVIANAAGAYTASIQAAGAVLVATEAAVPAAGANQRMSPTGPQQRYVKRGRAGPVVSWRPILCGAWGGTFTNWATSRAQFTAGAITDARRAGEYVHIFISDHLPLVMTIPI